MAVPALRIPVSLSMEEFERNTQRAREHIGTTLRVISTQFYAHNREIIKAGEYAWVAYERGWTGALLKAVSSFGVLKLGAVGALAVMTALIVEARQQLKELADVAEKAGNVNVSPEFLQRFVAEAKKARIEVGDLEAALTNLFDATKEKLDEINPLFVRLREFYLAGFFSTADKAVGFDLFRNAKSQEERARAILVVMTELNAVGQQLAALDIGEKAFGAKFTDNIRRGKTSAEEMLRTIESVKTDDIFSNDLVKRAEEADRRLKIASETLDKNLRPAWDGLSEVALTIKSLWTDIVDLLGKAASIASVFSRSSRVAKLDAEEAEIRRKLAANEGTFGGFFPMTDAGRRQLERRLQSLQGERADLLPKNSFDERFGPFAGGAAEGVPVPRPRPDGAPAPRETRDTGVSRDRFDAAAESFERRTAGIIAEAQAMDLLADAREKARVKAELETIAKQANKEAGLGENIVTKEQAETIERVAEAYGKAALAIENARSPLANFARESANVSRALNQFAASSLDQMTNELASVITGTKSAADAFKAMANSIINDLLRIAIRKSITGPIASMLGGSFGGGDILSSATSFIGSNAGGTDNWRGGLTWVGEHGKELINLPRGSQVIPNDIARGGMGSTNNVTVPVSIDARGADQGAVMRIGVGLAELQRTLPKQIAAELHRANTRGGRP